MSASRSRSPAPGKKSVSPRKSPSKSSPSKAAAASSSSSSKKKAASTEPGWLSPQVLLKTLVFVAIASTAVYLYIHYGHLVKLGYIKQQKNNIQQFIKENWVQAGVGFMAMMTTIIGLNIPGATMCALVSGIFFEQPYALAYVFTGYTCGAVISYCLVRFLFADFIKRKLTESSSMFQKFEKGVKDNDNFWQLISFLIFIRYVAFFPFWFVNASCAVLDIGLGFFIMTTACATLPGAVLYTFTGKLLGGILDKVDDSNSTSMILNLIYELIWTDPTAQFVLGLLLCCMCLPLVMQFTGGSEKKSKKTKNFEKMKEKKVT